MEQGSHKRNIDYNQCHEKRKYCSKCQCPVREHSDRHYGMTLTSCRVRSQQFRQNQGNKRNGSCSFQRMFREVMQTVLISAYRCYRDGNTLYCNPNGSFLVQNRFLRISRRLIHNIFVTFFDSKRQCRETVRHQVEPLQLNR